MKTYLNSSALLIAVILIAGCGGDDQSGQVARPDAETPPDIATTEPTVASESTPETDTTDATTTEPTTTEEPSAGSDTTGTGFARFTGRITVDGVFSELAPLVAVGDPDVKDEVCTKAAVPDDSVIVGSDGGLADVFVFAIGIPDGVDVPAPPEEPALLDQKACRFIPQALLFRVGQPLQLINSDPTAHNVHTGSFFREQFNQVIPPNDQVGTTIEYERVERVPVQTKCDLHTWMLSYHMAVDNPWFALSAEDGTFVIDDLPPGDWEFMIWHGKPDTSTRPSGTKTGRSKSVPSPEKSSKWTSLSPRPNSSNFQPTIHYPLSFPCAEPITT